MDDKLYIVLWQNYEGFWNVENNGVFRERRLAENLIECKKAVGEKYKFAIVEGPIYSPETMAAAEAKLGAF